MKVFDVNEWEFVRGGLYFVDKHYTPKDIFSLNNLCKPKDDNSFHLYTGQIKKSKTSTYFYPSLFEGKYYYTCGGKINSVTELENWVFCEVKPKRIVKNYTGSNLCISHKNKKN